MALTGGTGDVNPQWFKCSSPTMAAGSTMYANKIALPVQRLPNKRKAMVMEVIAVKYVCKAGADATAGNYKVGLATINPPAADPDSSLGYIVSMFHYQGDKMNELLLRDDLSDGAGHGMCIATDFVYPFIYGSSSATTGASVDVWILYRWKNIDLEEYSGILQAQSN